MPPNPHRVQAVFLDLVEKSPLDRVACLERECNGDQELRRRVDALLNAHDHPGSFLDAPSPEIDFVAITAVNEQPGDTIGPYKLLEQIGEGGFGVVFLAEQTEPVRRQVAFKITKPGMDTRQVISRFEAERQALAMMDHPNIAKVFDAGATEMGRPYFVMELVHGAPITEYCDQFCLTTRQRLELFILVCRAVQHAHQKGVIHRDIKPTNVLVMDQDGQPQPKIIDFGVAKALHQPLIEHTHVTTFAQIIGTPLYMAPEQAEMSQMGVDTRSDIYSLGVLLYELLTGTTPFEQSRLRSATYDELRRIICEEEPPRPSARLSTLTGERATTIAQHHRTDARQLVQSVCGDLDWIAVKCLEKDRNRRYETVNGLARDIERYLSDEPVTACPPSAAYRFRKFARRNKAAILAASASIVALLLLVAGLAISNRLIAAAREKAEVQTQLAKKLAAEQLIASQNARAEAAKSNAVVNLLHDMLSAAHPDSAGGNDYTVRQLVDQFSAELENRLADQPEVEATLRQIIGSVYTRLRLMEQAEPHLQRSLELHRQSFGEDHVKFADSLRHLAWNQLEKDRTGSEAESLVRDALAIYQKHADYDGVMRTLWLLMLSLDGQSRTDEAQATAREALELARKHHRYDHSAVPNILHHLAWINIRNGDYPAAERLARESVERHLNIHGDVHPETAFGWTYLGAALHRQGKFAEAERCYRKSLTIFNRIFPADHSYIRPTREDLMWALRSQGKYEEVISLSREAARLQPENAAAHNHLAWMLCTSPEVQDGYAEEALKSASKAVELEPENANYWNTVGLAQYRNGNWRDSIAALHKAMDGRNGGDSYVWFFLAMAEWQLGNYEEARDWYRKAVDWMQSSRPNDDELIRFRSEADALLGPVDR